MGGGGQEGFLGGRGGRGRDLGCLAKEADGADFEAEPLVGVAEVVEHDVQDGQLVDARGVDLQNCLGVALLGLHAKKKKD